MAVFPIDSSKATWSSTIASAWSVTQEMSASGRRRAVISQLYPKWTFKCDFKMLSDSQINTILGFFNARRGTFEPFHYKDYAHHNCTAQRLTAGSDGKYQCVAVIGGYAEPVSKVDNLKVYVNGVETSNYTETNGKITVSGSGTVTADYDYYFYVHFVDNISVTEVFRNKNNVTIKLETVR